MGGHRLRGLQLLLLLGASGCVGLDPACKGHFVLIQPAGFASIGILYPGDIIPLQASLEKGAEARDECGTEYTSSTSSGFSWRSTNPSVLSVAGGGVMAQGLGSAYVVATAAGVADSIMFTVAPRVESLHMSVTPSTPKTGDTVLVSVEPRDAAGSIVPNASISGPVIVEPTPSPPWLAGKTTLAARFVFTGQRTLIRVITSHLSVETRVDVVIPPP